MMSIVTESGVFPDPYPLGKWGSFSYPDNFVGIFFPGTAVERIRKAVRWRGF